MQRSRDSIVDELRSSQKKLTRAKSRKDQGTIRYLQARIKNLEKERDDWKPEAV